MSEIDRKRTANEPKYLDDSALEDYAKQDRLRHSGIVQGLAQILKGAPEGACIGFFGSWGSGKTSILRALEKQWNGNFVYFDAWRHDRDSFHCELIRACHLCVDGSVPDKVEDKLKRSVVIPRVEFRPPSAHHVGAGLWNGILTAVVAFAFVGQRTGKWDDAVLSGALAGIVVFLGSVGILRLRNGAPEVTVLEPYEVQVGNPPAEAPAEFSELFKQFLKKHAKCGEVIIAIDNLDRCKPETGREILACLNTFLNRKGSKCVVACDEDALVRHLESQYEMRQGAQSYLDKIFQIKVWLPAPSHSDLDELVQEMLSEIDVQLPAFQRGLLAYEFARNPRDLKRFLNDVQAVRAMLTSQVNSDAIPDFDSNEAVPKVVKLMLIRRRAGKLFSHYIRNPMDFSKHQ